MTLEQQVCSLELAKQLKKLGVNQKSVLYWVVPKDDSLQLSHLEYAGLEKSWLDGFVKRISAEAFLWDGTTQVGLSCAKYSGGWHVRYQSAKFQNKRAMNHFEDRRSEADARSKMLIYLLENKLISAR